MYGTELMYDGKQIQESEQIQLKFSKRMLGIRRQTSSLAVYGDTGQFLIIKYIVKIYHTLIWRLASMKKTHILSLCLISIRKLAAKYL